MVAYSTEFIHRMSCVAAPGAFLVEVFPAMRYLPEWLAPWKKWVNDGHRKDTAVFSEYVDRVHETMVRIRSIQGVCLGTEELCCQVENPNEECLVAEILRNTDKNGLSRVDVAWLASTVLYASLICIRPLC